MKNGIGIGVDYNSQLRGYGSPYYSVDFDQDPSLPSSITFSRASNATVTDSDGLIKYAPHNLLTNSESFEAATYSKVNATVTSNAAVSPNGTTTADKFIADNTLNQHRLRITGVVTTDNNIASIYAKADEYDWIILQGGGAGYAYFDVKNGVVGTQVNTVGTIESVGDGWYRCSVALTGSTTILDIWVTNANGTTSFTGDNVSGVYIWGAQLINLPCVSNDYISTSPANLLGFTEEFENAAWTKSNSFVQTNLVTYSEQFDNTYWIKFESTVTANTIAAPNGTLTADKLVENTVNNEHHIRSSAVSCVAGTYTASVYYHEDSERNLYLRVVHIGDTSPTSQVIFNKSTLTLNTPSGNGVSAEAINVGNGWWRISLVFSLTGTRNVQHGIQLYSTSAVYTGDGTSGLFIWGAQLVQGSTAGDYMQTGASTMATRYLDPFGSVYARKLVEDTAASTHSINQSPTVTSGTSYTLSCYAKASERNFVQLLMLGGFAANITAIFDLTTGAVGTTNGSPITQAINIGNGWWRFSITATATSTTTISVQLRPSSSSTTAFYTGDGTSGIYISGAQLSNSASLDPYVYNPTTAITSAARYGARFNYSPTGVAQGLLIEEQRTNSIRNNTMVGAVAGSPGTLPTNWTTALAGLVFSVVGTGTENGITYIDVNFAGTTTATDASLRFESTTQIVASQGQVWASSFYVRRVAGTTSNITSLKNVLFERTAAGGFISATESVITSTIEVTNITQNRSVVTRTLADATAARVQNAILFNFASGVAIDITLRIGLPQLELGAFATSVIPTFGSAAVTRNADNASILGRNFASWYNQSEGTVYADVSYLGQIIGSPAAANVIQIDDATVNNIIDIRIVRDPSNAQADVRVIANGSSQLDTVGLVGVTANTIYKRAFAFAFNNAIPCNNGTLDGAVDTTFVTPITTRLLLGNGTNQAFTIRNLSYWPTRLTNAQLQAITS